MAQATVDIPAGAITNTMIGGSQPIDANKLVSTRAVSKQLFARATSVAAVTEEIHIVRGSTGAIVGFQAAITGAIATGGDRTVTVDLHKSTGGGSFSTILSSTIQFTSASTLRTALSAVLSNVALVAGDILAVVVTVAGVASAQATGLVVTLTYYETYS